MGNENLGQKNKRAMKIFRELLEGDLGKTHFQKKIKLKIYPEDQVVENWD